MFLPVSQNDLKKRGIDQLDFIYVSGDAYVDHPSFGHAIITRVLEKAGYSVGIIAQPDWHSCEPFKALGTPRLGFLVSAGNIDSMVNHYTASKNCGLLTHTHRAELSANVPTVQPLCTATASVKHLEEKCP